MKVGTFLNVVYDLPINKKEEKKKSKRRILLLRPWCQTAAPGWSHAVYTNFLPGNIHNFLWHFFCIAFKRLSHCKETCFNGWTDSAAVHQLPCCVCLQVHYILQEVVMGGMVLETNMNEIVAQVEVQNRMEKSEVSLLPTLKDPACVFASFSP